MKIYSYYFEKNTLEGCLALFVQYPLPSHPPAPSKSQFAALFVQYSCATRRCGSNPRPLLALLYYYTTHSCIYSIIFPTYYTKPSVNSLFEIINKFKSKSYRLQSFITFRDLQFSFWLFPIQCHLQNLNSDFVICQIYGTRQTSYFFKFLHVRSIKKVSR